MLIFPRRIRQVSFMFVISCIFTDDKSLVAITLYFILHQFCFICLHQRRFHESIARTIFYIDCELIAFLGRN